MTLLAPPEQNSFSSEIAAAIDDRRRDYINPSRCLQAAADIVLSLAEQRAIAGTGMPATINLPARDNICALVQRELAVYKPGCNEYGHDPIYGNRVEGFQYVDFRRDSLGWTGFDLKLSEPHDSTPRTKAIRLLMRWYKAELTPIAVALREIPDGVPS